jgi:hypothetical protein
MSFSLDNDPSQSEISGAINYLLANFSANMAADPATGEITGPTGIVIAYLYRYLSVKYSDSADGSVNFSNSPTNRLYYGLRNSNNSTESTNPTDYLWRKVSAGGFSTTNFLFYQTSGGRQINFVVATAAPNATYLQDAGVAIDLDVITATTIQNGIGALTAYRSQSQTSAAPATPANTTGPTAPAGWSLTAPAVAVGNVLWYTFGQYNSNAIAVDGVPAGETKWGVPTAASVFQDIRSDNWNGSNPPVAGTPGTYGTAGYYIQRNTGDMFLNSIYARGIAQFDGANSVSGGYNAAILANASLGQNVGLQAFTNNSFLTSGAVRAYNQGSGGGNAIYASHLGTGQAILAQATTGIGVQADGGTGVVGSGTTGVQGNGSGPGGLGVQAQDLGGGTAALDVVGAMRINNNTLVTNLNADYLDGNHATAFAKTFQTNSGDANVSSSTIILNGNTTTGIPSAYVGTSGSGNTVVFTVQTTSPSDVRLKQEIENADLGLNFVNQLRPVSYKLIADPKQQKGYGFIADEVEDLIGLDSSLVYHEPDWQVGDIKGFKAVHYPSYIAILTKAIQELSAEVAALKAKG